MDKLGWAVIIYGSVIIFAIGRAADAIIKAINDARDAIIIVLRERR